MALKKSELSRKIKNFTINFGPQHPAAHGVLSNAMLCNRNLLEGVRGYLALLVIVDHYLFMQNSTQGFRIRTDTLLYIY